MHENGCKLLGGMDAVIVIDEGQPMTEIYFQ